jgi:hypothetical protein
MSDLPRLLMAVSGLGLIVIGIRDKKMLEASYGFCIVGIALFGYLARTDDMYSWFMWPFVIAMASLVLTKLVQKAKSV